LIAWVLDASMERARLAAYGKQIDAMVQVADARAIARPPMMGDQHAGCNERTRSQRRRLAGGNNRRQIVR